MIPKSGNRFSEKIMLKREIETLIRLLIGSRSGESFRQEYLNMRRPIAIALLASLALSASVVGAQAQGMGPDTARAQQQARDAKNQPPKVDENAYKNALKSVPAPKNVDPWGNMRSDSKPSR